jgi:hypothetical protein
VGSVSRRVAVRREPWLIARPVVPDLLPLLHAADAKANRCVLKFKLKPSVFSFPFAANVIGTVTGAPAIAVEPKARRTGVGRTTVSVALLLTMDPATLLTCTE